MTAYLEMIELGPTKETSLWEKFKFSSLKIGYHKIPFSRYIPESCFLIVLGIGKFTLIPFHYLIHVCLFSSCKPEFPGSRSVHLQWRHSYIYRREILQHSLASDHFGCVVHPLWQVLHIYAVIFKKNSHNIYRDFLSNIGTILTFAFVGTLFNTFRWHTRKQKEKTQQ